MGFIKGAGLFFISIAVIFCLSLFLLSLMLNSFIYPEIYINSFNDAGIYDYVESNMGNAMGASFIAMPEGGVSILVQDLLTNLLSYIRSDTDELNLTVRIDEQKLRDFFLSSAGSLSACSPNQDLFGEDPCLPAGVSREQFLNDFLASKNISFFTDNNDIVDLANVYGVEQNSEGRAGLDKFRTIISYYQLSLYLIPLIIILLWGLLYFMLRKNTKAWLRAISTHLIMVSIGLFLLAFLVKSIPELITTPEPLLQRLAETVFKKLKSKIILYASTTIAAGTFLFVLSFIIKNKGKPREQRSLKQ